MEANEIPDLQKMTIPGAVTKWPWNGYHKGKQKNQIKQSIYRMNG